MQIDPRIFGRKIWKSEDAGESGGDKAGSTFVLAWDDRKNQSGLAREELARCNEGALPSHKLVVRGPLRDASLRARINNTPTLCTWMFKRAPPLSVLFLLLLFYPSTDPFQPYLASLLLILNFSFNLILPFSRSQTSFTLFN